MIFARWQPQYAAAGLATFPVTSEKSPAVSNYLRIGLPASLKLAGKFSEAEAFGFALGAKSGLTILDIDTPDEKVLEDALVQHGQTPVIVRSGSGNFQAWYRHNGERRRIRPDPTRPIDILGNGFVVAPPSRVSKGRYGFIRGSLDDLSDLPVMENQSAGMGNSIAAQPVGIGQPTIYSFGAACLRHIIATILTRCWMWPEAKPKP